jgi:hypothetical protein
LSTTLWSGAWWVTLAVVAPAAWFVTAAGLMRLWGLHEAAPAIGVLVAAAVAVTLWRWAQTDREQIALAELRCPRCRAALDVRHEHARPAAASGVQQWTCSGCGYEHAEALTCAQCAA